MEYGATGGGVPQGGGDPFTGIMLPDSKVAEDFMLQMQKKVNTELTAWLTCEGVLVMPYEGYVKGKWQRNEYDKAYSNWFPVEKNMVLFNGTWYAIEGHIHTHPFDAGASPADFDFFNLKTNNFILSPNYVYYYNNDLYIRITRGSGFSYLIGE
ncbi:hypothetical protein DSECCO2_490300 [anaerobic digester metagenome]